MGLWHGRGRCPPPTCGRKERQPASSRSEPCGQAVAFGTRRCRRWGWGIGPILVLTAFGGRVRRRCGSGLLARCQRQNKVTNNEEDECSSHHNETNPFPTGDGIRLAAEGDDDVWGRSCPAASHDDHPSEG